MGLTFREEPVSKLAERFLPWAWGGFLIQVITGTLLFSSEASKMYGNLAFGVKMLLIVVAGINAWFSIPSLIRAWESGNGIRWRRSARARQV